MTPGSVATDSSPHVTVLMPVYNGERFLRAALESVLGQTYRDLELLVVDDASTDQTRAIVDSFDDARLRVLANPRNLGLPRSLNRGLACARGTYVARHDADDLSHPERLAHQVVYLDGHPQTALVGSAYVEIDEHGRHMRTRTPPCHSLELRWMLLFQNAFMHGSVLLRRSALVVAGVFDPTLAYAQDYDLWSRLSWHFELANLPLVLASYRHSDHSLTSTYGKVGEEIYAVSRRNVARLLGDSGSPAPSPRFDVEAAQSLLFGRPATLPSGRRGSAVAEILRVQDAFARSNLGTGERLAHRARVARQLATQLASTADGRRAGWLDAAMVLARAARVPTRMPAADQ